MVTMVDFFKGIDPYFWSKIVNFLFVFLGQNGP